MRAGQKGHYKNCCFMGHRDAADGLYPLLRKEVERHILQYGGEPLLCRHLRQF